MTQGLARVLARSRAGYSLLEVLVVVAIMGVAATLSGPSVTRMIESQQARQTVRAVVTGFGALRADAYIQSRPYAAETLSAQLTGAAPEAWQVRVADSVTLAASGYCTPGLIEIVAPDGRSWLLRVAQGDCTLSRADTR